MKLAIMQPYFLPYIGYFQLMQAVDEFIVYDNIKFTKKGWINRNRILVNGKDAYITLPLKKDSDNLNVHERRLSESWPQAKQKILKRISAAYRRAPMFRSVFPVIEKCISIEESNLFRFILGCLQEIRTYLSIHTPMVISSSLNLDENLKAGKKVIAVCKARNATHYVNPIGGKDLYSKEEFAREGVELNFLRTSDLTYHQFDDSFVPSLSIIDVMMFNPVEEISRMLTCYTLE